MSIIFIFLTSVFDTGHLSSLGIATEWQQILRRLRRLRRTNSYVNVAAFPVTNYQIGIGIFSPRNT
jgi:hypothetical protein